MNDRTPLEDVLVEGLIDWGCEASFLSYCDFAGLTDHGTLLELSIGLIVDVLTRGWMVPGDVREGQFVPWELSTGEAIVRIARDWQVNWPDLPPFPGSIVWFDSTEEGVRLGKLILSGEGIENP